MGWFSDMDSTEKGLTIASAAGIGLGLTGIAIGATANTRITRTNKRVTRLEGRMDQVETVCNISTAQSRLAAETAEASKRVDSFVDRYCGGGKGRGNW